MDNFKQAFELVLTFEGGDKITDDPDDPGGLTRWGISQRTYPDLDIRNLTREDAAAIYRRDYWRPLGCRDYEYSKALMLFDCAVNQGVPAAARIAQVVVNVVVDGIIGPKSHAAIMEIESGAFVSRYCVQRLDRYRQTKGVDRFFKGWAKRVLSVHAIGMAYAFDEDNKQSPASKSH